MSMENTPIQMLGLMIRKPEDLEYFKQKYLGINAKHYEDAEDPMEEIEDQICYCGSFVWASDIGKDAQRVFAFEYLEEEHFYSIDMLPAYPKLQSWDNIDDRELPVVCIGAEKQLYSSNVFMGEFYHSYEELEQEFKDKVGRYLPEDFDYRSNIADISYIAFG